MRYFYIEKAFETGTVERITGSDVRHIRKVLRCRPGDRLMLSNGSGFEYEAEVVDISADHVDVAIQDETPSKTESPVDITIAQAFLKERKMDDLVRALTELGVRRWIPFFSHRSVPKPDVDRLAHRAERWRKIARESLKQCRRGRLPEISAAVSFEKMLCSCRQDEVKLILWEEESAQLKQVLEQTTLKNVQRISVVLGPEGGFAPEEIETARSYGFASVGLGPRILKAETATVAAGALIQYLFGDLGQKRA